MNRILLDIALPTAMACACIVLVAPGHVSTGLAQTDQQRLAIKQIADITSTELAKREGYQNGDLITQGDVQAVLKALARAGWQPPDHQEILNLALPDDDPLVRTLATSHGKRFMRQSAAADLIFDRLDRVCRVYGGQRMIADMAKLPDGYKYAQLKRPDGVPGFLDLLPKKGSGQRRSIKHYQTPTGRIYTEKQLIQKLEESYQAKGKRPSDNQQATGSA